MGNKLYVTSSYPDFKIMHPDNTVICQVKISRAMSGSRGCKSAKAPAKERNNIYKYQTPVSTPVAFFFCFFFWLFIFKNKIQNLFLRNKTTL
jgi:hypothetical protein